MLHGCVSSMDVLTPYVDDWYMSRCATCGPCGPAISAAMSGSCMRAQSSSRELSEVAENLVAECQNAPTLSKVGWEAPKPAQTVSKTDVQTQSHDPLWLLKHFDITAQWHSGSSTIQESNEVRLQLVLIALTLSHVSFLNLIDITEPSCCKTYTISPSGCLCELGWTGGLPIAELILVRSLRL